MWKRGREREREVTYTVYSLWGPLHVNADLYVRDVSQLALVARLCLQCIFRCLFCEPPWTRTTTAMMMMIAARLYTYTSNNDCWLWFVVMAVH